MTHANPIYIVAYDQKSTMRLCLRARATSPYHDLSGIRTYVSEMGVRLQERSGLV